MARLAGEVRDHSDAARVVLVLASVEAVPLSILVVVHRFALSVKLQILSACKGADH